MADKERSLDEQTVERAEEMAAEPDAGPASEAPADADTEKRETPRAPRGAGRGPSAGIAHVMATFNNTIVTITDLKGNVISWSSAGKAGFKGSRKSTAFAATVVGQEAARMAIGKGMTEVEVRIQGPGAGRETAVRALQAAGLTVTAIKDVTPLPHDGCRPRKRRRV